MLWRLETALPAFLRVYYPQLAAERFLLHIAPQPPRTLIAYKELLADNPEVAVLAWQSATAPEHVRQRLQQCGYLLATQRSQWLRAAVFAADEPWVQRTLSLFERGNC